MIKCKLWNLIKSRRDEINYANMSEIAQACAVLTSRSNVTREPVWHNETDL